MTCKAQKWTSSELECSSKLALLSCVFPAWASHVRTGLGLRSLASLQGFSCSFVDQFLFLLWFWSPAGSPHSTRLLQTAQKTATCPCAPAPLPLRLAPTVHPTATSPWALAQPRLPSPSSALKNSPAPYLSFLRTWSPLQWTETSSLVGNVSSDLKCNWQPREPDSRDRGGLLWQCPGGILKGFPL